MAADLIARRLSGGRLLGIDRSEKAVAAAMARNAAHVAAGRARFLACALEQLDPTVGSFDKVLAVNVNLFWVRPALRELQLLRDVLRPGGRIVLVYEPPDPAAGARLETVLAEHLARAGLSASITRQEAERSTVLAVCAGPEGRGS